jgi:hypothetical protein
VKLWRSRGPAISHVRAIRFGSARGLSFFASPAFSPAELFFLPGQRKPCDGRWYGLTSDYIVGTSMEAAVAHHPLTAITTSFFASMTAIFVAIADSEKKRGEQEDVPSRGPLLSASERLRVPTPAERLRDWRAPD